MESNITDAEIAEAFENKNFGGVNHRNLLATSVFKRMVGYHCGGTITTIMVRMGLITEKKEIATKRGKRFVALHFHSSLTHGA